MTQEPSPCAECAEYQEALREIERLRSLADDMGQTNIIDQIKIEQLQAAIAYVRQRSQHACEILNEFDNTRAALEPKP